MPGGWWAHVKAAMSMTLLFCLVLAIGLSTALFTGTVSIAISLQGLIILLALIFAFFLALSYLSSRCVCVVPG